MGAKFPRHWLLWWWLTVLGGVAAAYVMLQSLNVESIFGVVGIVATPFVHGAAIAFTLSKAHMPSNVGILAAVIASCSLLTVLMIAVNMSDPFIITTTMPIWLAFATMGMFLGKSLGRQTP